MPGLKDLEPNRLESYTVLFGREEVQKKIAEMAQKIVEEYRGQDIVAVGILDGAVFFTVDLLRQIGDLRNLTAEHLRTEFVGVASYQGTETTEKPVITKELKHSIHGQNVLVIEDVLDSGYTLQFVQRKLLSAHPASLKTAVMVRKAPELRRVEVPVDYVGIDNVKGWLTGNGFDVEGNFRELRDIYVKKDTV